MSETKELARTMDFGGLEGTMSRPQSLTDDSRVGKEDIRPDEIQLPRLVVAQGLSPQMAPDDPKYIKGLSIGDLFNDVTNEIYGKGPVTVVPVLRHVLRIEFDKEDPKVVIDRDVPWNDPRLQWSKKTGPNGEDEPPRATEFVEFVCLLIQPGKPPERIVVSIKTSNKEMKYAAKSWTTRVDALDGPIYAGLYKIESKIMRGISKKNGQQTMYGVFVVKPAGFIPLDVPAGAALYQLAKEFHEASKGKKIVTEREAGDDSFDTEAMEGQVANSPDM